MAAPFPKQGFLADLLGFTWSREGGMSDPIRVVGYPGTTKTYPYPKGMPVFSVRYIRSSYIYLVRKNDSLPHGTRGNYMLVRSWKKYAQWMGDTNPTWARDGGNSVYWYDSNRATGEQDFDITNAWPELKSAYVGISYSDLEKRFAPIETPVSTGTAPTYVPTTSPSSSITQTGSTAGDLIAGEIQSAAQKVRFAQMSSIAQGIYGENWTFNPNDIGVGQNLNLVLRNKGFTQAEITAWFGYLRTSNAANGTTTIGSGGGGGGGGGNSSSGSKVNALPSITATPVPVKIRVKAPFGYLQPPTTPKEARPQLLQMYVPDVDLTVQGVALDKNKSKTEVFYFPYVPNDVTYSGLGSQWTEIPRGNSFPIVEWNSWNLMKISMNFLVSAERLDGNTVVPDGVFNSVGEQLNILRRMAQRPYPVSIYGMDQMMSVAIRRAAETGSALEFVISDLQIQSLRRTFDAGDAEITAASVSLTLQEIPIESGKVALLNLPSIVPDETPDEDNDINNQKEYNRLSDFTLGIVAPSSRGTIWTP